MSYDEMTMTTISMLFDFFSCHSSTFSVQIEWQSMLVFYSIEMWTRKNFQSIERCRIIWEKSQESCLSRCDEWNKTQPFNNSIIFLHSKKHIHIDFAVLPNRCASFSTNFERKYKICSILLKLLYSFSFSFCFCSPR